MNFVAASNSSSPPLIFVQSPTNKFEVTACTQCGCTHVQTQIQHLRKLYSLNTHNDEKDKSSFSSLSEGGGKEEGKTKSTATTTAILPCCSLGCGATYCSEACRERHFEMGHRYLCVGPYDEDHPLYKYTLICLESGGAYEEFMIAAHIVVGSLLGTNTSNKSNVFMNLTENDVLQISQMTAVWHTAMNESDEKLPPWW
jgi:hypothetical protein